MARVLDARRFARATSWGSDLILGWKEGHEDNCATSCTNHPIYSDFHDLLGGRRKNGTLIAGGHAIRRVSMVGRAQIVDLAPAFLYLPNLAKPVEVDRRVLADIFEPAFLQGRSIRFWEARESLPSPEAGWSLEQAEEVKARLRGLGTTWDNLGLRQGETLFHERVV